MSRENLQDILSALVPFAKQQIEDMGSCPPVAASMDGAGEMDLHLPPLGVEATGEEFADLLKKLLREGAQSGRYEATGICLEVSAQRMGEEAPRDALCVHLEAPGESLHVFVPYTRDEDGEVVWEETFFGPADPEIYAANAER